MSNKVFPHFQGWSYSKTITPVWNTQIYESESGIETRIQKWKYPRYKINVQYNFLTDNTTPSITLEKGDVERLEGFFNSVNGSFDDFLFFDDTENHVENQTFGVGDGQQTEFQLVRSHPYFAEPIRGIVEIPQIFVDGELVASDAVEVDPYGVVTFAEPPEAEKVLSWTGKYYFRVRFTEDELEITRTWQGLWEGISIEMETVK